MLKEAGVEVRYGASVHTVRKSGAKITGLTTTDGTTLEAKVFVDASYEGDLMARVGVKYAVGREVKAEFGEEAPASASTKLRARPARWTRRADRSPASARGPRTSRKAMRIERR